MARPEVPIEVDPDTGVWTVDGLPMVLVPRHYLVNHHKAIEAAVGAEENARLHYEAGHASAWYWCEKEAATHDLAGIDVFHHYMKRLSQRGWARFTVEAIDAKAGRARVRVDNSVFVAEAKADAGRPVCYAFLGWFTGSLEYVCHGMGAPRRLRAVETRCAADGTHNHCQFEITPA